jgi:hypothetical protein
MLITDAFIGFHSMIWAVYLSFVIAVFIGYLISKKVTFIKVFFSSLAGSILFFIITNFAYWLMFNDYSRDFSGSYTLL